MRTWRIILCISGILTLSFGAVRVVTVVPFVDLLILALWLIGAVVIHDGVIAPLTVGVGALLTRVLPARVRRYVQGALVVGGLVTVIAIPLILRRDSQPASKAILQQNYGGNLTLLLGIIAAASLVLYAVNVGHDAYRSAHRPSGADPERGGR